MTQLTAPATGPVGDKWGPRPPLSFHHGWDFEWLIKAPDLRVFAAADGKVIRVYWDAVMGWCIEVDHGDIVSRYCHLADAGLVKVGDRVARYQHIATMGSTGSDAHGELHLHFDVWVGGDSRTGTRVDPAPYFASTAGGGATPIEEKEETEMTLSITRIVRKGVGEFYMFASPTIVSVTRELSTLPADQRTFEDGVMKAIASAVNLGTDYTPPLIDDSPNNSWYLRDRIAGAVAGMPTGFPLSATNPFILKSVPTATSGASKEDVDAAAERVIAAVPTAVQNGAASRTAIVK